MRSLFKSKKGEPSDDTPIEAVGFDSPSATETAVATSKIEDLKEVGDDGVNDAPLAPTTTSASEKMEYPEGLKLGLILLSIFVSMFLVALVRLPPPATLQRLRANLSLSPGPTHHCDRHPPDH
jgi:hypothetical protein